MNSDFSRYLRSTSIIDSDHADVRFLAGKLAVSRDQIATAKNCFEWVRDEVKHCCDYKTGPSTSRASDVLHYRSGFCYAKSHLLAALLRAIEIPAGFCYQRLSVGESGPPYCLHGFNAIWLPEFGWYRVDARGNRPGIEAKFDPPREHLAFNLQCKDEFEFANIFADPLQCVVESLEKTDSWEQLLQSLPDIKPECFADIGLQIRSHFVPSAS